LEQKIVWKTSVIPPNSLDKDFRGNAVQHCEVGVQHDLLAADEEDGSLDVAGWNNGALLGHRAPW